ncbi:MAG: 30S ribosomal protein S15 [Candidatus ainarchaeum sp.]|nr:30S ribosomal protein S15 [Candidatus ainarchaeum sp.]
MAKIHSKKRGKSKSRKLRVIKKTESKYSDKEIIEKIHELSKKGMRASEIGMFMRDNYGVGDIRAFLGGKRLVTFLKKENISQTYPQDILDLIKKAVTVRTHMKKNKTDKHNKVKLAHIESKIGRLIKYYKKEKVLPKDWKYDPETAHLLLK